MSRLASMVANLPHYFNKDPQPSSAIRVKCNVGATFVVGNGRLRATPTSGSAIDITLDRTLDSLATAVNAVTGYTGEVIVGVLGLGAVSATTLIDGTYNGASGDYVTIPYFTSANWRMLAPMAQMFTKIDEDLVEAFSQADLRRSDGAWLDHIGGLYGILRSVGEPDSSYARRITESVIAAKCNGFAIASILQKVASAVVVVTDTGPSRFAVTLTLTDAGNPYDTGAFNNFINTYKAFGTYGLLNLQQSNVENDGVATDTLIRSSTGMESGEWAGVEFGQTMFAGTALESDGAAQDALSGEGEFGRAPFGSRRFG